MRYAVRKDGSQSEIVHALRGAGVKVWVLHEPCDLLTFFRGRWLPLECKTPTPTGKRRKRMDQAEQDAFLAETGCPVVLGVDDALRAVGVI